MRLAQAPTVDVARQDVVSHDVAPEDDRLTQRVLPAVIALIERGDFTGPVMRKVASECRMSLNTLYSIVPGKTALLAALAVHLQQVAQLEALRHTRPTDTLKDVSRLAMYAAFDAFTAKPGLALAALATDLEDPSGVPVDLVSNLFSSPGMPLFSRESRAWTSGVLQVLTVGWLGTTYTFARGLLTEDEARAALENVIEAAFSLDPTADSVLGLVATAD